jgi:hypothetical protein
MRIVAGTASYTLPEVVAVDRGETSFRVTIDNGELVEAHAPKGGSLSASGIFFGLDHLNAETLEMDLLKKLSGELKLYRHDDSIYYKRVVLASASIDPYRGRFNGRVTGVTLRFEALDGYRYGADVAKSVVVDETYESLSITNPGVYPEYATILFTAWAESSVNGNLIAGNGKTLSFAYDVPMAIDDDLVITDRTAVKNETDVTAKVAIASLVSPLVVAPGSNTFTIYGTGKNGALTLSFTPRWPG